MAAQSAEPFEPNTVANARDFLAFAQGRCPIPKVFKGYWNTILFDWGSTTAGPQQIEVFNDRLEVYRFEPTFSVWYEPHKAGQPFSPRFLAEFPPPD